ncbi:MAG: prepilin-type N-terminal cleavage/methylation domain-containing protein [Planctomycetaceae bacterium]
MKRTRHCAPRGFTLVELVVVLGVASILVGSTVGIIHLLLASERQQERAARTSFTLANLSRLFRADVHAAVRVQTAEQTPATLALEGKSGSAIVYRADLHVLTRVESSGGREIHRETFQFPASSSMGFEFAPESSLARLTLALARVAATSSAGSSAPPRIIEIEAVARRGPEFSGRVP